MLSKTLDCLLFLDLEINPKNQQIFKIGALRVQNFGKPNVVIEKFEQETPNKTSLFEALKQVSKMAIDANYLVGHNIIQHDIPILTELDPSLNFLKLDRIDTLQLSPLAFPKNPYHRLLKDYKLIRSELNSPLQDCEATYTLLQEQLEAFHEFAHTNINELRCYQTILSKENPTYAKLIADITHKPNFTKTEFPQILKNILLNDKPDIKEMTHKVCMTELNKLIDYDVLFEPETAFPFLYTLSWLRVSGENSVLAPWVRHQFPETSKLIKSLRDNPCSEDGCSYCSTIHDPRKELQRYFKFDDFRYENEENGESIQRDIVKISMSDENVFAILPTGGGKSLCYQLPALNRFFRNGSLTIIISPLQALMKDQVDGLIEKQIHCAAALNGLLSMPERADVLEKIQMGDVGLLFVSPEQFRSPRFKRAIAQREIGAWVYDEAHCLSKWGNDFRPDYLYVAKCIKEISQNAPLPPIGCFTATAKQEVIDDIKEHFTEILGIEFTDKISLKERENLSFDIIECAQNEKVNEILHLLSEYSADEGGAIIFVARRKIAEDIAKQLQAHNWSCQYFHAGMPANEKKDIQNAFIKGEIKVIVSTNAFGMGVDKKDVRLVIHADIPGSLENYLQEAGRAGRDQDQAKCVLLYDANDIETQFRLTEFSKVTHNDIAGIYKKLRSEQVKRKNADIVISSGEILKDALVETIDIDDDSAKTKVVTAIAWLERAGYLERIDNVVRIFPSHLKMTLNDALEHIKNQNLGQRRTQEFSSIVEHIAKSPSDKIVEMDILAELISGEIDDVSDILQQLQELEILTNNTRITTYIRHGITDTTQKRLEMSLWCETALLELLSEVSPDIESGEWRTLDLTILCNHLNQSLSDHELRSSLKNYLINEKIMPPYISKILKVICEDKASLIGQTQKSLRGHTKIIEIKNDRRRDAILIKVNGQYSWQDIRENGEIRRTLAQKVLNHFLAKVTGVGKDLLVETTFEALQSDIFSDMMLADQFPNVSDQRAIIETTLLYLHNLQMLTLNHGMTVMCNALTIKVDLTRPNRYFVKDYEQLKMHYKERRLQIHVMREYAEIGLTRLQEALRFVLDYFSLTEPMFIKKYFKGREEILALATSEESWRKIVENLNDVQRKIVESEDENRLILAGPGSGKTRVIVHRIAYLLRVQRIPAHSIIALAYNRSAANEIRQRLYDLVGKESYGVTVMTYHGIAMRLTGNTYQNNQMDPSDYAVQDHFKAILKDAIEMLRSSDNDLAVHDDEDDARSKLLQGYRYILVDEYQDIDEDQYDLISALAGRNSPDEDGKLTILAVGDDDQNIYTFRGSSNRYIDLFKEDYHAKIDYLIENYRSTQGIIQASNDVIEHNPNRLKSEFPITVDKNRLTDPYYGRWEEIDSAGRAGQIAVRILVQENYRTQAYIVLHELKRLVRIDKTILNSCAILARSKKALNHFSGGLKELGYPFYYEHDKSSHFSTPTHRYFQQLIDELTELKECQTLKELEASIILDNYPERWQNYFKDMFLQLHLSFDGSFLDINSIIHWIYDYAYEMPITTKKGVFLGTIHSAKGLEFDHVFILDHLESNFEKDSAEERRLFYVGMTRAKETLMLCSFGKKNSIIESIRNTIDSTVDRQYDHSSLQEQHVLLSPKDIYMDYLSHQSTKEIQDASLKLEEGSALTIEQSADGTLLFKDSNTQMIVAKSSKNFEHNSLDPKDIIDCHVHSISQRNLNMVKDEKFKNRCHCESWEVVQPMIKFKI